MIRFGPAGIPLSCKGRTLEDGIEDVHNLGLAAMEVQLVRINVIERFPTEEEVGLTPRTLPGELVVALRREGEADPMVHDPDATIEPSDTLHVLVGSVADDFVELEYLGTLARELDVEMSLHTPYYMDLAGDGDLGQKSLNSVRWGGMIAHHLNARVVVTHMGLYGELSPEAALARILGRVKELADWFRKQGLRPILGLETSGRQEVFGSVDEVVDICEAVPEVMPVLNFGHIHAREGGSLREPADFGALLNRTEPIAHGQFHCHFAGVEHEGGNELRYTPIKRGDLRFEPLVESILDAEYPLTVISSSPLLEHDAMYMKVILERVLGRKVAKRMREGKEEAS
ncbi:MAG: TIM barrel protein [Thermoplasmata archaeon]